jgi:hypothetical protein
MCCFPTITKLVVTNHAEIIAGRIKTVCGLDVRQDYFGLFEEMQRAGWMQQLLYIEEAKEQVIKGDEEFGIVEETLIGIIDTHRNTYEIRNHASKGVYIC